MSVPDAAPTHGFDDAVAERPLIVVCAGKDCAGDRRSEFRALLAELSGDVDVVAAKCLDVCKGPVAVIDAEGHAPVVVERVRKPGQRRAVRTLATQRRLPKKLQKLVVTGKKGRKAAKKAAKRLRARR
jgi:(2Fe-2S) ferredoxin